MFVLIFQRQQAFDGLKQALISASVSALPDFSIPFCIYTDACKSGIGADALYRYPGAQLSHIYRCTPTWTLEVVQGYQDDPQAQELLTKLVVAPDKSIAPFSLHQGLIRHKGRVWLGNNITMQTKVISVLHDSAVGGHFGFPVTYR